MSACSGPGCTHPECTQPPVIKPDQFPGLRSVVAKAYAAQVAAPLTVETLEKVRDDRLAQPLQPSAYALTPAAMDEFKQVCSPCDCGELCRCSEACKCGTSIAELKS